MAITAYTLNKPWIWAEATTGGSLSAATYYFIGFNCYSSSGSYYGYAPGTASDQISVTTDATNNRIIFEIYESGGYVTAYADTGDSTHVTVTSNGHGMSNGDTVYLRGTANYKGAYTVSSVTTNTFDIVATWVSNDGASNWYKTPGLPDKPTNFPGSVSFFFKWDYYSMLRGDGSYFQWLNTNDATFSNEWYTGTSNYDQSGHTRWGGSYYNLGVTESQLSTAVDGSKYKYFSAVVITTANVNWNTTNLYERGASGSISSHCQHPQLSMRKYSDAAATTKYIQLPDGLQEDSPAVAIFIDNSDSNNNWYYLVNALETASGVIGGSVIITIESNITSSASTYNVSHYLLVMRGCIFLQNVPSWTSRPTFYDKTINILQGSMTGATTVDNALVLSGCTLTFIRLSTSFWVNLALSAPNTKISTFSVSMILDTLYTNNTTIQAIGGGMVPNYYLSCDGAVFLGSQSRNSNTCQVLRNNTDGQYVRNCRFVYIYPYKATAYTADLRTFEFTDCSWEQPQNDSFTSGQQNNCDIYHLFEGTAWIGQKIQNVYNHTNSKNERSDGIIKIYYATAGAITTDSIITHNFYYDVNIKVTDIEGNAIENATITMTNSASSPATYTDTTDSNGDGSVSPLCYTIEYDADSADGYYWSTTPYRSKTTLFNDITLTISKSGYETYTGVISDVLSAQDLTIALKPATIQLDQEMAIQI